MPFALMILLLILWLVFSSGENAKKKQQISDYQKEHPPHKFQEEYLKACELYLEYRRDRAAHPHPARDAKHDAAMFIKAQGFLPACLDSTIGWDDYEALMWRYYSSGYPAYMSYEAIERCNLNSFQYSQREDDGATGYHRDNQFWDRGSFKRKEWNYYCYEMDSKFNDLVDRFTQEVHVPYCTFGPKIDQTDVCYPLYHYNPNGIKPERIEAGKQNIEPTMLQLAREYLQVSNSYGFFMKFPEEDMDPMLSALNSYREQARRTGIYFTVKTPPDEYPIEHPPKKDILDALIERDVSDDSWANCSQEVVNSYKKELYDFFETITN